MVSAAAAAARTSAGAAAVRKIGRKPTTFGADRLVALTLAVGSVAVLAEAYVRTDLAEAERPSSCSYGPSDALINAGHVRTLERNGMVVIPNALSTKSLLAAREDVERYSGGYERHGNDDDVRQDTIAWLRRPPPSVGGGKGGTDDRLQDQDASSSSAIAADADTNAAATPIGRDLAHCIDLIRGVASALEDRAYVRSASLHRVPLQCQLALYRGDRKSGYARHLDRCRGTLQQLGLLEWLRLSDYRSRAVTAILYLNDPGRTPADGGVLRCWLRLGDDADKEGDSSGGENGNAQNDEREGESFASPVDVQPTGGTLLIFDSDRLEHMVLPSSRDRYALTVWVSGEHSDTI